MRDAHRMKEKLDLSLDNRQVVSLLIGGTIVLAAVFVLGVVVGKKLATSETASAAPDLLTALDQSAAAMQEVRDEPPLTFQEELTRKAPPLEAPAAKVEPARVVVAKAELPKAEPQKVEPATGEEAVAVAVAPKPEGQVQEAPVPTRSAAGDGGLRDAFARVNAPAPARPPVEAKAGGAFTLQLSATQNREEADRFAAALRQKGYAPFVVQAEVPGRGLWYRVRMGSFPSKDAAARYLADFKRETQLEAFVAAN